MEKEQTLRRQLKKMLLTEYSEECEVLGAEKLTTVVDQGLSRAKSHGFEAEEDVELYFDIMFSLAFDFDTDPKFPWAQEILGTTNLSPEEKLKALADGAAKVLQAEEEDDREEMRAQQAEVNIAIVNALAASLPKSWKKAELEVLQIARGDDGQADLALAIRSLEGHSELPEPSDELHLAVRVMTFVVSQFGLFLKRAQYFIEFDSGEEWDFKVEFEYE